MNMISKKEKYETLNKTKLYKIYRTTLLFFSTKALYPKGLKIKKKRKFY
jgi:hypothetical protein